MYGMNQTGERFYIGNASKRVRDEVGQVKGFIPNSFKLQTPLDPSKATVLD